jgi:hypothetical protein
MSVSISVVPSQADDTTPSDAAPIVSIPPPAELTLGGETILRLAGSPGGFAPQARVDAIMDRLTPVLATPDLKPSDVVIFAPAGAPPAIYVLGRGLITVDNASAKASGIGTPMQTAVVWAKKLQQILPLVDIRLPNEPEPVLPKNPPLLIATKLSQVGGSVGEVDWNNHLVLALLVSPVAGVTPAQYTDTINRRLAVAINEAGTGPITITTQVERRDPGRCVDVLIGSTRLLSATKPEAVAAGITSQQVLAEIWAGNLQRILTPITIPPPPPNPTPPVILTGSEERTKAEESLLNPTLSSKKQLRWADQKCLHSKSWQDAPCAKHFL